MALRAMKYNELSHIIFPGKQETSRSLGNPTGWLESIPTLHRDYISSGPGFN